MAHPKRNVEIKARCRDLVAAARAARKLGAQRFGVLHQTDTYFRVRVGRLKLRETRQGSTAQAELIAYRRANRAAARTSSYFVVPIPDAELAKSALAAVLGVRAVVTKRRELWMYQNVRMHLDRVNDLGEFIELEAVVTETAGNALFRKRLSDLCDGLGIAASDLLGRSYVDLVRAKR